MAVNINARTIEPLERAQLWQAHMPINTFSVDVFEAEEERAVGVLTAFGSEKYTKEPTLTTPFTGNDRFRWLSHAVFREGGALRADVEYGEVVSCLTQGETRARRLKDTELSDVLWDAKVIAVARMLKRTAANTVQLNRFIDREANIHIGFGMAGVSEFHVARLIKVATSPVGEGDRQQPFAVIQGKDGVIGKKPIDRRVRRELFIGNIAD